MKFGISNTVKLTVRSRLVCESSHDEIPDRWLQAPNRLQNQPRTLNALFSIKSLDSRLEENNPEKLLQKS